MKHDTYGEQRLHDEQVLRDRRVTTRTRNLMIGFLAATTLSLVSAFAVSLIPLDASGEPAEHISVNGSGSTTIVATSDDAE